MRRTSPKLLVLIAAVLSVALLAFVFAGGGSSGDRPPRDRLTDEQVMTSQRPAAAPAEASEILPGSEEVAQTSPPPPPPEPEVEPGPVTRPTPIVRPAPPPLPRRSAEAQVRQTARPRPAPKARAEAPRPAEVRKAKPKAVASAPRRAASPAKTANAAPARTATARPSYNCRYARTRSEVAVCGDAGLAGLDQQMAAQFNTAYRQATRAQREVLERSRLRFLYRRDRCQSASCIAEVYQRRMSEINDIAARNWREP
jgi:outer membrane biosynthesis protein TonB